MASPLTITRGGVYSGDWTDVSVQTTEPVVLEKGTLTGTANVTAVCDLIVRNLRVTGPDTWESPRWLVVNNGWKRLEVSNCTIMNTRGIELWPNTQPSPVTLITRNYHRNIKGNGITPVGNFVQLRQIWGSPKWGPPVNPNPGLIEISWNEIVNEYQKSNPEDVISIYKTAKTRVHDNLINGQSKPSQFTGSSQNTITIDPADEPNLLFDNQIIANFVIDAYSIGMFGGNNNLFKENYVVSDGYLGDSGVKMIYGYSGMFISSNGTGNQAVDNHVGYINGTMHGSQRVDYQEDGGTWMGNTHLPAPITRQTELDHIAMWRKRVSDAGITIGAGGDPPVSDLTIFRDEFVPNIQTANKTNYAQWKQQNPGEAAKWETYRDALLAGGNPTAPVLATKYGKALVAGGKMAGDGVSPPPDPTYLFQDEFTSYNPSSWQRKWWFNGDAYYHDQTEQIEALRDANVTFNSTGAFLTAKRENVIDFQGRSKQFTSGMLQSNGIQGVTSTPGPSFTYGKFEARIKAAAGPGMWSCFWLCDAGWPSNCPGEIDIVEIVGPSIKVANNNLHAPGTSGTTGKAYDTGVDLSAGFHVYGLEWRQTSLVWTFDGAESFRYTGPGIPTTPHYILLNLQIGGPGSWAGTPPLDGSTLPAAMQIDWLRVSA